MYKSIYDIFKHWYNDNKGTILLYSDPHFSDTELYSSCRTGMTDDEQIRRINSKVGKNDTIIFLGDIGNVECMKKIKGRKILIKGNHDSGSSNYLKARIRVKNYNSIDEAESDEKLGVIDSVTVDFHAPFISGYKNVGYFDEVYEGPLIISNKIILSHEPVDIKNFINIHGHCHSKKECVSDNHINICAERIDYTPVRLSDIIKSGKLNSICSLHRETIDRAIKNSRKSESKK